MEEKMKKQLAKWTALMLALVMVSILAACGGAADNSPEPSAAAPSEAVEAPAGEEGPTGDAVVITWYESTDNEAFADAVAEAFNASREDIQVEVVYTPQDSYEDKMKSLLAGGGSEVDVFHSGNVAPTNLYGANGATLDLAPYLETTDLDLDNFGGKIQFATIEDGRVAGMPDGWGSWFLYYNKAIFDEAGEPYPTELTWDEYADLAMKFTDHANQKWGGYYPNWTLNLYGIQQGGYLTDEDLAPTAGALEMMNRLYNTDNSHMDVAEMTATGANPISMFETGDVAMMINGEWAFSQLKADTETGANTVEWGVTYLPIPEGVAPKTGVGGVSHAAINANSAHPDEAWEFMEFLVGPEGATIYATSGNLPAYVTDEIGQYYIDFFDFEAASLPFDPELTINAEQGQHARYGDVVQIFRQNAELYLLGETTIDEFAENFAAERDAAIG
jgi:multiple sugar transport system substrate-binding protein